MKDYNIMLLLVFALLTSCSQSSANSAYPIKQGTATLKGKITGNIPEDQKTESLTMTLPNSVVGDRLNYEIPINADGSFSFDVPVAYTSYGFVESPIYTGGISLVPNESTVLNIHFNAEGNKSMNVETSTGLTADELIALSFASLDALQGAGISGVLGKDYKLSHDDYVNNSQINIDTILNKRIGSNTTLSTKGKQIVINNLKLFYLDAIFFEYPSMMRLQYLNYADEEKEEMPDYQEPNDKSYYSFLKDYDLNNPDYLSADYYPIVLQALLQKKIFDIPLIEDKPIDDWIAKVKEELKDLLGTDKGLVYDMFISNAYGMQLNEMQPLTDTQKSNIKNYFKGEKAAVADILLAEDDKIIAMEITNRKAKVYAINKTPDVPKEKLMEAIIARYKDKVVFVDFWATWCGPCISAMKKAEPVKEELKDVVYVYITTTSSPAKLWEHSIPNISGEHYYVNEEEWDYLFDQFDIEGIPTYLIYDKKGKLHHNHIAFMGADKMKTWLEELL